MILAISIVIGVFHLPITFSESTKVLEDIALDDFFIESQISAKPEVKELPPPPKQISEHQVKAVDNPPPIELDPVIDPVVELPTDMTIELPPIDMPAEVVIEKAIEPVAFAEVMPQFPGGELALLQFLSQAKFPTQMRDLGLEDKVSVKFVIDAMGNVTAIEALRGEYQSFIDSALKRVSEMPKWTPGRQGGKNVPVIMIVPLNFTLAR